MIKNMSPEAQSIIDAYTSLSVGPITLPCLYYNNRRKQIRAGLRVSIGKGSPTDIQDEIKILAQKDKVNLQTMDEDMARMFLQKHNIGIDCSGLAYYILDAEMRSKHKKSLAGTLKYPFIVNPLRKLLVRLRSVENTNVKTLAHDVNSAEVPISQVQPGDMITILNGGTDNNWYHVMVITEVQYANEIPTRITYIHSYQWPTDGTYHHGIRTGTIDIIDTKKPLLEQQWTEQGKTGKENTTRERATQAKSIALRRLHAL